MSKSNDEQQGDRERKSRNRKKKRHRRTSSGKHSVGRRESKHSIGRRDSKYSIGKRDSKPADGRRDSKHSLGREKKDKKEKGRFGGSKQKLSKKQSSRRFFVKSQRWQAEHISKTIQTWKLRWKNKYWRQKWKYHWGKNKWKVSIRKKWTADKKWRRKWMKKILKKWWDKKWRRKWLKKWIDSRWLAHWNRKRQLRKRLWKKQWRKCGAKRMGLTFNEFLLTERRLKTLQTIPDWVINKRRIDRHYNKEKIIKEKLNKRAKFWEETNKLKFFKRVWNSVVNQEYYGPETFEIRPSVIQFKFYMLNAIQGLVAFLLVLYFHLTNDFNLPPEFVLQGLYILVYFASAMDFYGSIFGMVTSFHLETYYRGREDRRKRKKRKRCCRCWKKSRKRASTNSNAEVNTLFARGATESLASTSQTSVLPVDSKLPQNNESDLVSQALKEEKKSLSRRKSKFKRGSASSTPSHRHKHSRKHYHENAEFEKARHSTEQEIDSSSLKPSVKSEIMKCTCRGLGFLYCCMIRKCFRPGRSREFINRMGYSSWILLQLAWFLNVFFTAYYNWVDVYYKDYKLTYAKCEIYPRSKTCEDFDWLFSFMMIVVGVTFILRNIFLFIVGMCFSERHLRRCQSPDPFDELASTCSDTDIDYNKVPRPILVPHVMSGGKYPYVLTGPCRPVDYMLAKIAKVSERNQKAYGEPRKSKRLKKKRNEKRRRRLLTTHEKEAVKVLAGFKQVRRARTVLEKGKRKPWRIPVAVGVTDQYQLPPELMTTKAWAWLYDDDDSTEEEEGIEREHTFRERRQVKWRRSRKRKVEPIDSAVLTTLRNPASKSKVPIEEIVKPKLKNLSNRDSTDKSWSGNNSSLFETASGYSSDNEMEHRLSDAYLELMSQGELWESEGRRSAFVFSSVRSRPSKAGRISEKHSVYKGRINS